MKEESRGARGGERERSVILASASPRRQDILRALGWQIQIFPSGLSEEEMPREDPVHAAQILALRKAQEVAAHLREGMVLGADTMVHLAHHLLGKPKDADQARDYLQLLSGRDHFVTTGLALIDVAKNRVELAHETTRVRMHPLSRGDIEAYLESGEPFDKAGAYAIQGRGMILIDKIWGCYSNVVGLPVGRLRELWGRFAVNGRGPGVD